jgi:hypothetical protein
VDVASVSGVERADWVDVDLPDLDELGFVVDFFDEAFLEPDLASFIHSPLNTSTTSI